VITFVEVKTRRTDAYGSPSLAVGPDKRRRLRKLAALWLSANPTPARVVRFDVVSVIGDRVEVIENAF
jgi:putative endonuclease